MQIFNMGRVPPVTFGAGRLAKTPDIVARLGGTRVLVVADAILADLGITDRLEQALTAKGLSCDLAAEIASAEKILDDIRWRRFLLSRDELEQELLRLHQHRKLRFEIAGSVVSLELPHKNVNEYVEHLVG